MKKIIVLSFFLFPFSMFSQSQTIIFNEIAWMGTSNSTGDEWIELYNMSDEDIDLSAWVIEADDGLPVIELSGIASSGEYFLLERTNDESVPAVKADFVYTGGLGNDGEGLSLKNKIGETVDYVDASQGWPAGDNLNKKTMERKNDFTWQTSAELDGTPKAENSSFVLENISSQDEEIDKHCGNGVREDKEECDDGNNVNNDGCDEACLLESLISEEDGGDESELEIEDKTNDEHKLGSVMINEIVSDPEDEESEWVEIVNCSQEKISLSGWVIEEGSGAKTKLSEEIEVSGSGRYFVIEKLNGKLNNQGDVVVLRDQKGKLIDKVVYGNWGDNVGSNAPVASDPKSLVRKYECEQSYSAIEDFALTTTKTYADANIVNNDDEESELVSKKSDKVIFITEMLPNPTGVDEEDEWIELYNPNDSAIELLPWRIEDASGKSFSLEKMNQDYMEAKSYLVLSRSESKIALNNNNEEISLWYEDVLIQEVVYEKAISGEAYLCVFVGDECNWFWSDELSLGKENMVVAPNIPPEVSFDAPEEYFVGVPLFFDSSDTVDNENDKLSFFWNFGDGATNILAFPEHTFFSLGTYVVRLTVSDQKSSSSCEKIIKISNSEELGGIATSGKIVINEFLPNPEGNDADGEFIELYNDGKTAVNLFGWQVDDEEKGSRPYTFKENFILEVGQYFLLDREEGGLALNNSVDSVRLFDSQAVLVDSVDYQSPKEENSFVRVDDTWHWSSVVTPKEKNVIKIVTSSYKPAGTVSISSSLKKIKLEEISSQENGQRVITEGRVAVLPGVFGSQYFYIADKNGVQVYSYNKNFPDLALGDLISVQGEISSVQGEKRIKTTRQSDIVKLAENEKIDFEANEIACDKICEDELGGLLQVTGVITERQGTTAFLDDGTEEVKVYLKPSTGIDSKILVEGEKYAVKGILSQTSSGLRLLPRFSEDIVAITKDIVKGEVLGESIEVDEWTLPVREKTSVLAYFVVFLFATNIILGAYIFKIKKYKF